MFRYRLRTLLILMAVGPPIAGWLVNTHRHVQERRQYFSRFNDHEFSVRRASLVPNPRHKFPKTSLIRRLMGDHAESTLLYDPSADKSCEQFKRVRKLFPEAMIWGWYYDTGPLPPSVNRLPPNTGIII